MTDVAKLLADESDAIEANPDAPIPPDTKITTRGVTRTYAEWTDVRLARMLQAGATDAELITELRRQRNAYRQLVQDAWKIIAKARPDVTSAIDGPGFVESVRRAVASGSDSDLGPGVDS